MMIRYGRNEKVYRARYCAICDEPRWGTFSTLDKRWYLAEKVKKEISFLSKYELMEICDTYNIDYEKSMNRDELLKLVREKSRGKIMRFVEIYHKYKADYFGMTEEQVEYTLDISVDEIKSLKKKGFLKVQRIYEFYTDDCWEKHYIYYTEDVLNLINKDIYTLID